MHGEWHVPNGTTQRLKWVDLATYKSLPRSIPVRALILRAGACAGASFKGTIDRMSPWLP